LTDNLEVFRQEFLNANTWAQRKEGVPLDLLDNLSAAELKTAEIELIQAATLNDTWPIIGLGHIRSKDSLPILYALLVKSTKHIKVTIAHSIFQICADSKMIDIVLEEVHQITDLYEIISILYMLPSFKDERVNLMLNNFRTHKDYLVAYNATRYLGLPTDEVVAKFSKPKAGRKWWQIKF
jgi:hypothetical protein